MYHNHSGKYNICDDDINHQYIMALKWYQTIETLCYADMHAMISLIEKRADLDANTVNWMHPLDFSYRDN